MSTLLQGIAWGLGTARARAAMGRAILRVTLALTAMILMLLAVGYLLDAANGALAAIVGPVYAALIMGAALLMVAVVLWLTARQIARRRVASLPASGGEAGRLLLILLSVLAGVVAARSRSGGKKA